MGSMLSNFCNSFRNTEKGMNGAFTHLRLNEREITISDLNAALLEAAVAEKLSFRNNGDHLFQHALFDLAALCVKMAEQKREKHDDESKLRYEHQQHEARQAANIA